NLFGIKIVLTALLVSLIALSILIDIFFLTPDLLAKLFKTLLLVVFLYFGYSLIRSVIHEIQLREKLEKTYQELKKLNKAKSEFLSIASHQLRTPLSAIKGYISMLLEGSYGPLPEKAQKSISSVYQSNERLIKLVNDILNVSRIEAGGIEIDFQKIDLEEIIKSVINELSHGAQRKNIDLKFEKPSKPLPRIIADSDKMRHIILNIIDNAIRYTDKGEVITQIQPKNHNRIIIKIKDTGLGMTQKEIAKLFKSFSRGSAGNRSYTEGSGLGLYIAKRFVEMHHGKINAESKGLGKGSTITIEIPVQNSLL
ncbi:HAMP domain-containing histidine kinase, partial [Patescibacteria group bacterium]|nr:HAMP domain-containing histidine kinase [Patescibacteria group bacterium]MBU1877183.1 HAMP domain-containing histidine kinase [Patescibacteria group bacterium]